MKLKKALTILITTVLAITILTVSVCAWSFVVGGRVVDTTLSVTGVTATATVEAPSDVSLSNINIEVSGYYEKADGSVDIAFAQAKGSGRYLECRLIMPTDGIKWTDKIVAYYAATYNNDSSSTSITKLVY